jgi:hypothetical protein
MPTFACDQLSGRRFDCIITPIVQETAKAWNRAIIIALAIHAGAVAILAIERQY